jgi:uncharacterized damage-inducible protein DinB
MSEAAIIANFLSFSAARLQTCGNTIATCLGQLTEEQIWYRGGPHENSVGNLVLHLEGNIRQWILHGIAGHPDVRRRDDEFSLTASVPSSDALASLTRTLNQAREIIATLPPARLREVIDPQPTGTSRHATILEAIYKIVNHLDHHTGQIILLTKQLAARDLDLSIPRPR